MNTEYQFNVIDDFRGPDGPRQHLTLMTHPFLETVSPVGFLDAVLTHFVFTCLSQQNIYPLLAIGVQQGMTQTLSLKS